MATNALWASSPFHMEGELRQSGMPVFVPLCKNPLLVSDAAEAAADDCTLVVLREPDKLPPILAGHQAPKLRARAESFYVGLAELFERWAASATILGPIPRVTLVANSVRLRARGLRSKKPGFWRGAWPSTNR